MPQFILYNHILAQTISVTAEQMHCGLVCNYIIKCYFYLRTLPCLVPSMDLLRICPGYVGIVAVCSMSPSMILILSNFIKFMPGAVVTVSSQPRKWKSTLKPSDAISSSSWFVFGIAESSAYIDLKKTICTDKHQFRACQLPPPSLLMLLSAPSWKHSG